MDTITRKQLDGMIEHLNRVINRPAERFNADNKSNIGHLMLEKNNFGYTVTETISTNGATREPFGANSHSATEMYWILRTARDILDLNTLPRFPVSYLCAVCGKSGAEHGHFDITDPNTHKFVCGVIQ